MEVEYFCIRGFLLAVDAGSFLVTVHSAEQWQAPARTAEQLPGWVFDSPLAIWLTSGQEPVYERSLQGERVKHSLLTTLQHS